MNDSVLISGLRDVRASITDPDSDASACVVACPPHPQMGGTRSDNRLTAVSDALEDEGIASLRFDYGDWDEGSGERTDAMNAIEWATDRYDPVGLFGFSFGATISLLVASEVDIGVVSALAPTARIAGASEHDAVNVLSDITCPVQIAYGERDSTVDWEPVVERARTLNYTVTPMRADHFFLGQTEKVADRVVRFLVEEL